MQFWCRIYNYPMDHRKNSRRDGDDHQSQKRGRPVSTQTAVSSSDDSSSRTHTTTLKAEDYLVRSISRRINVRQYSRSATPKLHWTTDLHDCFKLSVERLGGPNRATPKQILQLMGVEDLTIAHIKSHLQMYRLSMKNSTGNSKRDKLVLEHQNDWKSRDPEQRMNDALKECQPGSNSALLTLIKLMERSGIGLESATNTILQSPHVQSGQLLDNTYNLINQDSNEPKSLDEPNHQFEAVARENTMTLRQGQHNQYQVFIPQDRQSVRDTSGHIHKQLQPDNNFSDNGKMHEIDVIPPKHLFPTLFCRRMSRTYDRDPVDYLSKSDKVGYSAQEEMKLDLTMCAGTSNKGPQFVSTSCKEELGLDLALSTSRVETPHSI